MKPSNPGAVSGCLLSILLFFVLGGCLLPAAFFTGSVTSTSSLAIQTTGEILCPSGSLPTTHTYPTTTTDEFGNSQPSTAYELHCIDATGQVVKADPIVYGFLWIGMLTGAALLLVILLTVLLAAPAGVLIGRIFARRAPPTAVPPA